MIDNEQWNLVRETVADTPAKSAFAQIEKEVERLVRDYNGALAVERDLRNAMEADSAPGAQIQRRG